MSPRNPWIFRTVAAGVPALAGAALLLCVLAWQGWLSVDDKTGRVVFRRPPLYLQEPGYELTVVPVPRPGRKAAVDIQRCVDRLDPIQVTVAILQGMQQACAQHGCHLVLMKFGVFLAPELPFAIRLNRDFVRALTEANLDLSYLDLDAAFRQRNLDTESLLEGNDDGHWNAHGHQQVAEILYDWLEQREGEWEREE